MHKERRYIPLVIGAFLLALLGCIFYNVFIAPASAEKYKVAYIPLDNRPVNQERMRYLAQSADITLIMPEEAHYRTVLDPMQANPDGSTSGNREALCQWLLQIDKECDHFIISLDQMTSGGLVGSRWLCNDDLKAEYSIIDAVLSLCENNTVYLFDTVMRLAPTVGYQGYSLEDYNILRAYGMQARKEISEDALTVKNITQSYSLGADGATIQTDIPADKLAQYHAARTRKLKLIDYTLKKAGDNVNFFYVGVDDSSPQNTIQTNEIRYIRTLLGENSVLGAATDEIALCCLARMILHLYNTEVSLQVTYFGGGENAPADGYDIGTLAESMQNHLDALSANSAENGLQALCLTRGSCDADRTALLAKLKSNQASNIPTVLIDVSEDPKILAEQLLTDPEIDICRLLGYSSWNTAANAIGLALSQGIGRYAYLSAVDHASQAANEGFLRTLTFSYIKDISYKSFHPTLEGFLSLEHPCAPANILARLNDGKLITALNHFRSETHGRISVSDFRYPWDRTFEMCFDIRISKN